jgi:hypothetical protein
VQTKPVKQESQILGTYAGGKTLIPNQLADAAAVPDNEDRLRRYVEHSPDAVAIIDCEMRYVTVSRRWETDCGLDAGEAIGRFHWEVFHNVPQYWLQNARACLAGILEYSEFVEMRPIEPVAENARSGRWEWVKWVIQPWKNSSGAIGGSIVFTEKVASEIASENCSKQPSEVKSQQLEIADLLTKIALDRAPDTVFCISSDGRIDYANEAAVRVLGYSQSELLELTVSDIDPHLLAADWSAHWEELKLAGNLTFESSYKTKEGATLPVEVKVSYLEWGDRQYCCTIARDICDRKAAESALLEAKEQLQAVLDAVPGFVSWVSSDLRYLGVNKHLAAAYKLEAETFIGQKVGFLDNSPLFNDLVYEFFASNAKTVSKEITVSIKDATKTYLIVAQKYQKGSTAVFVGLDVTERKQTLLALQESEERLRQQAAKLEQTLLVLRRTQTQLIQTEKMSFLGQLMAGIAHEINNPVSFISGNISHASGYINDTIELLGLYQKHYPDPAEEIQARLEQLDVEFIKKDASELLRSMKVGSERIRDVVRSLRLFSRPDEAEMKPADIHEGLDSTLLILQNRLQAKGGRPGINLIKEYGNLPKVECYAGQLNQVFMHLLTNAIDALEEGGKNSEKYDKIGQERSKIHAPHPQIRIRTEVVAETEVAISISDNGPGMTEEVLACIFDPLFTTKSPGTSTGLGLAISHHLIVEKHGGQLYCFSQPEKGTELIIQIAIDRC